LPEMNQMTCWLRKIMKGTKILCRYGARNDLN
jgi:hypothetical protein